MLGTDSRTKVKKSLLFFVVASLLILPTQIMLTDSVTPTGIADLEIAGSLQKANETLDHWGDDKRWAVWATLILDFPFLIAYTLFFFYLTRYLTEKLNPQKPVIWRIGQTIAGIFILAGLCDIFENVATFPILLNTQDNAWALIVLYCASLKFVALGVGLAYLILAGIVGALSKRKAS